MRSFIKKILGQPLEINALAENSTKIKVYSSITDNVDPIRTDVQLFSDYDRFKEPRLNAKIYKILPHLFFDTGWSIWVDGNVLLHKSPEEYVNMVKKSGFEIGVFRHPRRNCIYVEAELCGRRNLDDPKIIEAQMQRYRQGGYKENAGLAWCGLIIRKHTANINRLNEKWWAEICTGSVRDQISFPYVFRDAVYYLPKQKRNFDSNKYFTCGKTHLK